MLKKAVQRVSSLRNDYLGRKHLIRDDLTRYPDGHTMGRQRTNQAFLANRYSFETLEQFESASIDTGNFSVWYRGLSIDFSLRVKPKTPLVVVFHGAAPTDVKLPFLSGSGITADTGSSVLLLSDPSLYLSENLHLAWFSGSAVQFDLVSVTGRIISRIYQDSGASHLVFLGGSGGGFASLNQLGNFPEATAIAMNPQTDILRYHQPSVQRYLDTAWESDWLQFDAECHLSVFPAVDRAKEFGGRIFYLQNSNDDFHVENHLAPFRERYGQTDDFLLLLEPWRDGHTPPPKEIIKLVLTAALTREYTFDSVVSFQAL